MTFEELNLAPAILDAVREQGYEHPTPVQAQAIPAVLAGADVLAGAQTGTGKTAGFTLPILHLLSQRERKNNAVRALVLTPTRELAAQVEESVRTYGKNLDLTSTVVFGGVGINPQIKKLRAGVDILVATPGRLLDLVGQGALDLSHVEILVLDEADRMLDMGFIHDVKKVLAIVPERKQSLLFSATFSDEIRALANNLLRDPQHIQVTPKNTTVQRIAQWIYPVGRSKKKELLAHVIEENNWSQVLVFTRTKFGANHVAQFLSDKGITAMALHGNKSQAARTQALAGFKSGEVRALVATDIAARGIDIDDLPHVVNYEIPNISEDYVHRIGRTGRAGASGEAVSLVCMDEEGFMQDVERFINQRIEVKIIEGFGPDAGEKAEPIAMGRQVLWGGIGKPPARDVMAAAGKAARGEMMQRIREKKATTGGSNGGARSGGGRGDGGQGRRNQGPSNGPRADGGGNGEGQADTRNGNGGNGRNNRRRPQRSDQGAQGAPRNDGGRGQGFRPERGNEAFGDAPRRNAGGQRNDRGDRGEPRDHTGARQPDPLRTSIDAMSERRGGGGNGGNRRRGGPGGGNGGGNGGNGGGNRGPADPLRTTFGRIK
jgi:ATP-dependent RNA helicase RhlE